ncbi:MAG TPA: hypothetical protein VE860_07820, partial [Chthoniobacterales bacterium]|nr:hypothetical protein [Chthoniobacterales bacterium]
MGPTHSAVEHREEGVEGMTPGPVVVCAVGPGSERWAEAGAVIASAATLAIATPFKRVLMSMVLRWRVSGALSVLHTVNVVIVTLGSP